MVSSGVAARLLLSSILCCAHADIVEYEVQENQTLYFASQGWRSGVSVYRSGFYGGLVDIKLHGYHDNLTSVVMDCFLTSPNLVREDYLKTRGMSYDPVRNKILLHMFDHRRTSVLVLPRCVHPQMCHYDIIKHREDLQAKAVFSYGTSSDRSETCPTRLQPFGIYANKVYFVAKRVLKVDGIDVLKLELRQMGCTHELFHSQHPFDVRKCSELIATLEETSPDRCHLLNTAHHLYITPHPNPVTTGDGAQSSSSLTFLLQVFNRTDSDFSINLMAVSKGQKPRVLYSNPLPYSYFEYTDVGRHLGGIDYKDGTLCWSAITSIFCAPWPDVNGGDLGDIETVLPPYAAASAGACYVGPGGPQELANFTTGVAIASVDEEDGITLFFGCEQELDEWGGAGMLRLLPDTGAPVIFPMRQNNNKIHAGFMFLATPCDPNGSSRIAPFVMSILYLAGLLCVVLL